MNEHEYPIPVRQFVKTLIEICRHQDRSDLVEILENSHPRFEENEEFSDREKETLWKACKANDQVYNAHNVRSKIYDKSANLQKQTKNSPKNRPSDHNL